MTQETCVPIFSAMTSYARRKCCSHPWIFKTHPRRTNRLRCTCQLHIRSRLQKDPQDVPRRHRQRSGTPPFKLQVANGNIEAPTKTILLHSEIGDWNFKETLVVVQRLTGPELGLTFLKNNSVILERNPRPLTLLPSCVFNCHR